MSKAKQGDIIFKGLPTGSLCNAHPRVRAMTADIGPLFAGAKLAGPAKTAVIHPGQNAALHRTLAGARPGDVLVVDGGGCREFGPFGDILASACRQRGIAGLVIDSTVRDLAGIREIGFPVFPRVVSLQKATRCLSPPVSLPRRARLHRQSREHRSHRAFEKSYEMGKE